MWIANMGNTAEMMRAYRDRWKIVAAREIAAQRSATIDRRWRQFNALIGLAIGLELPLTDDTGVLEARRRWMRLKATHGADPAHNHIEMAPSSPRWHTKDGSIMTESNEIAHLRSSLAAVQRLLERFNNQGIVIGGVAASLLGKPRLTNDIDVTILASLDEIAPLLRFAAGEGLVPRITDVEDFARQSRVLLLVHQESNIDIDIALGMLPFEVEAVERSIVHQIGTLHVRLPTPEDLIILKAVAHRPRDLEDIQHIIQSNPDLDRERVKYWVAEFAHLLEAPDLFDTIAQWL